MKRLSNLLAALVFASLVIFMSCGGGGGGGSDPTGAETNAALMDGTWTTTATNVTYDGSLEGDWSNFTLTINNPTASGGSYSVSGVPTGYEDVWPTSNTNWTFNSDAGTAITRGDNVSINITVSADAFTLQFTVPDPGGRSAGLYDAPWVFTMAK